MHTHLKRKLVVVLGLILIGLTACSDAESPTNTMIVNGVTPVVSPNPVVTLLTTATAVPPTVVPPTPVPSPTATSTPEPSVSFDGDSAYAYLQDQMDMGPRWPGSPGHAMVGDYIRDVLEDHGWEVGEHIFPYQGLEGRNIIGHGNIGKGPVVIIGAHYDTRKIADQTPGSTEPVPGAVDGASGVAVLLELARTLELEDIDKEIWLTFFDVEDQGSGGMPEFSYIVGSTFLARNLTVEPEAMVLVDMIGDADQQLFYEGNSDESLRGLLWQIAAELGYGEYFIPEQRHVMLDDHIPFAERGIPAVDIIDFDYPYWHTVEDTADKASPDSLERVGRTLEEWLENYLTG